ncbi:MAG TPA: O-antigen ligase family protein, partial [Cyclobacteriaceae bacterium]|nr:O-antigen ligase family protein [Cyclobacteriaceae bacterium]
LPILSATAFAYYIDPDKYDRYMIFMFIGMILAFILQKGISNVFNYQNLDVISTLFYSRFSAESELAYLIGLFTFYFLFKGKSKLTLLGLILTIISGKRGAIAAVVAGLIFFIMMKRFYYPIRRPRFLIGISGVLLNVGIIFLIFLFTNGEFDNWIRVNIGLPSNTFTNGRYLLWKLLIEHFHFTMLGVGTGSSHHLLTTLNYPLENPLNDILKICLENGLIIFVIWTFIFYYINSKNIKNLTIVLYTNILFLSTNVLIYFFYMLCFYLVQMGIMYSEEQKLLPGKNNLHAKRIV